MEEGGKEAFCLLLWFANGGRVGPNGKPDLRVTARGLCSTPFDCDGCQIMQDEIARHPPGQAIWVCPTCATEAVRTAKESGTPYLLPGHYTSGLCQYKSCTRTELKLGDEVFPARYSSFLQLFIGQVED